MATRTLRLVLDLSMDESLAYADDDGARWFWERVVKDGSLAVLSTGDFDDVLAESDETRLVSKEWV